MTFNYSTADRACNNIFLQFPKVFLSNPVYRELSDSAKIGYMVLKDLAEYSLQNGLVDEENRVYFIYTDQELAKIFNKSIPTARKIKQELIEVDLLKKVDMGFNKEKRKQNPNRLYLADLVVE